jgi:phosphoglycerol transferase MdoB-like AlkP superfamily enzyme
MMISRKNHEKKSLTWIDYVMMFVLPLVAVGLIEGLHRRSIADMFQWILEHPMEVLFTYIFIWGICTVWMIFSIQGYYIGSVLVVLLLGIFAYGSSIKGEFRGEPIIPSDFLMISEAGAVSMYVSTATWIIAVLAIIVVSILIFFLFKWGKQKNVPVIARILLPVVAVGLLVVLFNEGKLKMQERAGISFITFEQRANYDRNGLTLAFIDNLQYLNVPEPEDYTEETIKNLVGKHGQSGLATPAVAGENKEEKKPNVVVIMSEAFFDPTKLPNVSFSEDPLPNFHRLQQEHIRGEVNVSVFGGGTANTEFEALTGMSTKLTPAGAIPYIQYVNKPTPSMAWQFRQAGYDTLAMTMYHNWFYKVNDIYKYFGFEHLISMEFFPEPEQDGYYIKDKEMMKSITKHVQDSEKPTFIYGVTMQGHGPYPSEHEKENIKVEGSLAEQEKGILQYYANTMHEIDASIKQLTDDLRALDEPTIVLYFGDHLPSLGNVYNDVQFSKDKSAFEDHLNTYNTPLLVWDNYSGEKGELTMSAPLIGPYLLDRAGVEGNHLTNYLFSLFNAGHRYLLADKWQTDVQFPAEAMKDYSMLQYDILFGERYGVAPKELPTTDKFSIGVNGPEIKEVVKEGEKLLLKGDMFTDKCKVKVNGEEVSTTYGNPATLQIDAASVKKGDKLTIHLYDSINMNIFTSKEFFYEEK